MRARYVKIEVQKGTGTVIPARVLETELPILAALYGKDSISAKISNKSRDIDLDEEYIRLSNKFGAHNDEMTVCERVYGLPEEGKISNVLEAVAKKNDEGEKE